MTVYESIENDLMPYQLGYKVTICRDSTMKILDLFLNTKEAQLGRYKDYLVMGEDISNEERHIIYYIKY